MVHRLHSATHLWWHPSVPLIISWCISVCLLQIPPADFAQRAQLQALAERSELQGALLLMYSQHEVACGPERLVSLLQLLGSAMFRSPGSAAAARGVIRGGQENAMKQGLANAEALVRPSPL